MARRCVRIVTWGYGVFDKGIGGFLFNIIDFFIIFND